MSVDVIDYQIIGDDLQAIIVTLDPQEAVVAEAGAMMYMESIIHPLGDSVRGVFSGPWDTFGTHWGGSDTGLGGLGAEVGTPRGDGPQPAGDHWRPASERRGLG